MAHAYSGAIVHEDCRELSCDPVREAASAGTATPAPIELDRSRFAASRKSRCAAKCPGHLLDNRAIEVLDGLFSA
jgi:hypothetical protein